MEINYTPEQDRVVHSRNKNLLVSASAGSGKTTIMIKRIVDLMVSDKVPLEKFLIVTFTKASAEDMKRKLIDELKDAEPSDFLLEQIMSVPTADISNLHSFCSRLIAKYFYRVGLDPVFSVIEESEQLLLMERAADSLFEEQEREFNEDYFSLFEIFQKKRSVDGLKSAIFKINGFANSILGGIDSIRSSIERSHDSNISKNACARLINIYVCSQIADDAEQCEQFAKRALDFGCNKYYEHFSGIAEALRALSPSKSYTVNAKNLMEIEIPPTPSKLAEEHKFLSKEAGKFKDGIKKNLENYRRNYISADPEVLKSGIEFSKTYLLKLLKLTESFEERYKKLKRELNVLDFNDLEKYALEILGDPALLEDIRQKYSYIFVDEYQDINEVQERLISLLSKADNLFMVGDIKQSIYRFRYCDPDIFLDKSKRYESGDPNSALVRLNCNFRSDKNILAFVDSVFSGVMTEKFGGVDYASKSCFEAGEKNSDDPSSVGLCFIELNEEKGGAELAEGVYSVKEHEQTLLREDEVLVAEANFVAQKISQLIGGELGERLSYSDIVILTPSRKVTNGVFMDTLKNYGIPIASDDELDLMSQAHIDEIVNFLKLSANRLNDIAMFKVLKSRLFNFSDNELIEIRLLDSHARFFECVEKYNDLANQNLKAKVRDFLSALSKYEFLAKTLTARDFVVQLVKEFELEQVLLCSEGGAKKVHELNKFVGSFKDESVLEFVSNCEHYYLGAESESSADAVKIMSIHGSKGMEFKAVFLVGAEKGVNFDSTYGDFLISKQFGAGLGKFDFENRSKCRTIVQNAISMQEKRILVEEYQRLLYVALTRAKNRLFVVCSATMDQVSKDFPKRAKCFFDWFNRIVYGCLHGTYKNNIVFEHHSIDDFLLESSNQRPQLILSEPKSVQTVGEFVYPYSDAIGVPLKNSVSKILNEDEGDFDDEYEQFESMQSDILLRSSAERGTAYHRVFQFIDFKNLSNAEAQVKDIICNKLSEAERALVDSQVILKVLKLPIFLQIKEGDVVLKEREFFAKIPVKSKNNCAENSDYFTIQGVIDLLVISGDSMMVLDYKTGKINDEKRARYAKQLDLYADVASRAFEKKVSKKLLVMIDEQKLIEI